MGWDIGIHNLLDNFPDIFFLTFFQAVLYSNDTFGLGSWNKASLFNVPFPASPLFHCGNVDTLYLSLAKQCLITNTSSGVFTQFLFHDANMVKVPIRGLGILLICDLRNLPRRIVNYLVVRKCNLLRLFRC